MGLSHCFGSESIIYYNILSVYQINFRRPANAFIYCVCGREKNFWRVFFWAACGCHSRVSPTCQNFRKISGLGLDLILSGICSAMPNGCSNKTAVSACFLRFLFGYAERLPNMWVATLKIHCKTHAVRDNNIENRAFCSEIHCKMHCIACVLQWISESWYC